jgi:hypothetical protein
MGNCFDKENSFELRNQAKDTNAVISNVSFVRKDSFSFVENKTKTSIDNKTFSGNGNKPKSSTDNPTVSGGNEVAEQQRPSEAVVVQRSAAISYEERIANYEEDSDSSDDDDRSSKYSDFQGHEEQVASTGEPLEDQDSVEEILVATIEENSENVPKVVHFVESPKIDESSPAEHEKDSSDSEDEENQDSVRAESQHHVQIYSEHYQHLIKIDSNDQVKIESGHDDNSSSDEEEVQPSANIESHPQVNIESSHVDNSSSDEDEIQLSANVESKIESHVKIESNHDDNSSSEEDEIQPLPKVESKIESNTQVKIEIQEAPSSEDESDSEEIAVQIVDEIHQPDPQELEHPKNGSHPIENEPAKQVFKSVLDEIVELKRSRQTDSDEESDVEPVAAAPTAAVKSVTFETDSISSHEEVGGERNEDSIGSTPEGKDDSKSSPRELTEEKKLFVVQDSSEEDSSSDSDLEEIQENQGRFRIESLSKEK